MRTLRRVMLGASVSALALVAAGSVNAEAAGSAAVVINQDAQELEITPSDAESVFVSYDAVKKDKLNAKATWNYYSGTVKEGGSIVVDLSALKTTKAFDIAVKVDTNAPTVYHFDKIEVSKVKATYKPKEAKIEGLDTKKKYEYRTAVGNWDDFDDKSFDFEMYEQQGATLYFREKATEFDASASPASKDDGNFSQVDIKGGSFPGKEFKVKITKKAKGPSLKIDYVKGTIPTPKNGGQIMGDEGWKDMTAAEDLKLDKAESPRSGLVMIRTKADDKKPASNPVVISYDVSDKPVVTGDGVNVTVKCEAKAGGKGTVTVKNNSDATCVVYVTGKDRSGEKALLTLKAGKEGKIAESKAGSTGLVIAYAADSKTGKFQSDAEELISAEDLKAGLTVATPAPTTAATEAPK